MNLAARLVQTYQRLEAHFGHEPHWWPIITDDPLFEVLVGAVLVQQTRWQTVEAAIYRLRDAGLSVPEDVSVVGFDDIHIAGYLNPPLTTIAQPMAELGRVAAELLLQRMQDRTLPPRRVMLRNRLMIRRTTANAPKRGISYFVE